MFDAKGDLCVGFWAEVYATHPELLRLPDGAAVLEIGSADVDWLAEMSRVRPDLDLTGIDLRAKYRELPGRRYLAANVLTHTFEPASFDAAVAVSTVEHIGCEFYSTPPIEDGDTQTMRRLADWVKPGGWCYLDVPFRPGGEHRCKKGNYRAYSPESLAARLIVEPWTERYRQVFSPDHIDGPYVALILERQ